MLQQEELYYGNCGTNTLKDYAAILSHAEYYPLTQKDVHNILSKKKVLKSNKQ